MSKLKGCKAQFKAKYRMLHDFSETIFAQGESIASSISLKYFRKYYSEAIEAFQVILENQEEMDEGEMEVFKSQFSELNKLAVKVDVTDASTHGLETKASGESSSTQPVSEEFKVKARLPIISLHQFNGELSEWLSFSDLFESLVHNRTDLSDSEKHYYLRASVSGEALSVIRHLPMDAQSYAVAFSLLKARYHNVRMLTDSYLDRILRLPVITNQSDIRRELYDPLRESTQALEKLQLPVSEWSYLLLFITLQKLPTRIRTLFEERHGKVSATLPTFTQLMELLDEQCRLQLTVSDAMQRQSSASERGQQRGGQRQFRTPIQKTTTAQTSVQQAPHQRSDQVNRSFNCTYCSSSDHGLYKCAQFLRLLPKDRKTWAWNLGLCFRCFRKHLSQACTQRNWCKHCNQENHNTLLCNRDGVKGSSENQSQHSPRRTPAAAVQSSDFRQTKPEVDPGRSIPTHVSPTTSVTHFQVRRQPEARVRLANQKYEELRFGKRGSDSE